MERLWDKKFHQDQSGMGLAGAMVGAAVTITAGYLAIEMYLSQGRAQRALDLKANAGAYRILATQYAEQKGGALCTQLLAKKVSPELTLCGQLDFTGTQYSCGDGNFTKTAASLGVGVKCDSSRGATSNACDEVFLARPAPAYLPSPPAGLTLKSSQISLAEFMRGPSYSDDKPEYVFPLSISIGRDHEVGGPMAPIPLAYYNIKLRGAAATGSEDPREIVSCAMTTSGASSTGSCLPGQISIGVQNNEVKCAPEVPCTDGQSLMLIGGAWTCTEQKDEGMITMCRGECL